MIRIENKRFLTISFQGRTTRRLGKCWNKCKCCKMLAWRAVLRRSNMYGEQGAPLKGISWRTYQLHNMSHLATPACLLTDIWIPIPHLIICLWFYLIFICKPCWTGATSQLFVLLAFSLFKLYLPSTLYNNTLLLYNNTLGSRQFSIYIKFNYNYIYLLLYYYYSITQSDILLQKKYFYNCIQFYKFRIIPSMDAIVEINVIP